MLIARLTPKARTVIYGGLLAVSACSSAAQALFILVARALGEGWSETLALLALANAFVIVLIGWKARNSGSFIVIAATFVSSLMAFGWWLAHTAVRVSLYFTFGLKGGLIDLVVLGLPSLVVLYMFFAFLKFFHAEHRDKPIEA